MQGRRIADVEREGGMASTKALIQPLKKLGAPGRQADSASARAR